MITFTKEPTGIYPVYNDSYIEFSSDLINNNKAEITINSFGTNFNQNSFIIYPDKEGKYLFNLKEIMKALFNKDGFNDKYNETPSNYLINGFGESIFQSYRSQVFTVKVFNGFTSESEIKNYTFYRSVKQIGERVFTNPYQILNRSINGIDYNLTYFEGFPFAIDLQRVTIGTEINIKNLNNGIVSQFLEAGSTNTYRMYIDTGTYNWTTEDFLPLTDTINRFEIYVSQYGESNNRVNLNIKKKPSVCGVYLKWFNNDGGYSYWLFDEFTENTLTTKDLSTISTNKFFNVDEGLVASSTLIGKTGNKTMKLSTQLDRNETIHLESLFTSPSIQMWSSQTPFNVGQWININVSNKFKTSSKKDVNKLDIIIELPELIIPTL